MYTFHLYTHSRADIPYTHSFQGDDCLGQIFGNNTIKLAIFCQGILHFDIGSLGVKLHAPCSFQSNQEICVKINSNHIICNTNQIIPKLVERKILQYACLV